MTSVQLWHAVSVLSGLPAAAGTSAHRLEVGWFGMSWIYKTAVPQHCNTRIGLLALPHQPYAEPGAWSSLRVQPDGVRKVERLSHRKALELSCSKTGAGIEKYKVWITE